MLAGRRAFDGATVSDAIAAVLTHDPDWSALPAGTPGTVRRLLQRCLARDATRRLRHAGDARIELEEIAATQSAGGDFAPQPARPASLFLPWAIAAIAVTAALGLGWGSWNTTGADASGVARTIRLELSLPPGLELFPSTASTVVASPDGQSIAFVGTSGGNRQLFLRRLDQFDSTPARGDQRRHGGLRLQSPESGSQARTFPGTSEFDYPSAVTMDGRTLLFQPSSPDTSFDILAAPLSDRAAPHRSCKPLRTKPARGCPWMVTGSPTSRTSRDATRSTFARSTGQIVAGRCRARADRSRYGTRTARRSFTASAIA